MIKDYNSNAYREYAIWVPKTLVTNAKGPIFKWILLYVIILIILKKGLILILLILNTNSNSDYSNDW